MSVEMLARLSVLLVLAGIAIGDLEVLTHPAMVRPAGFYSWDVLRTSRRWTMRDTRLVRTLDVMFGYPGVVVLYVLQLAMSVVAAIVVGHTRWVVVALAVVLATNLLLHMRQQYGMDGSDQMQTVVLAALVLFYCSPSREGQELCLLFIAAQALLSYFTAGFAKLISPVWRGGSAIAGIMNTRTYGTRALGELVVETPGASLALCWATIGFECFLPLLVLAGPQPALVFIAVGVSFHLGIAASMGLNLFFWSFVSTYPSLYYLATVVHG